MSKVNVSINKEFIQKQIDLFTKTMYYAVEKDMIQQHNSYLCNLWLDKLFKRKI